MITRPAFYLDTQICTGCKTCMVACKDKNDLDLGIRWRRVVEFTGGEWTRFPDGTYAQSVFAYYISVSCNHCRDPICVRSCPTTAMQQDEHGVVSVDQNKCVGCRYCEWGCPYSSPQFDAKLGKMTKCDFCMELLLEGGNPACVAACPTRALQYGELDELEEKYGSEMIIAPLPSSLLTEPCSIYGSHKNAQSRETRDGFIANPEEVRDA